MESKTNSGSSASYLTATETEYSGSGSPWQSLQTRLGLKQYQSCKIVKKSTRANHPNQAEAMANKQDV